jgi:hypothetical protein
MNNNLTEPVKDIFLMSGFPVISSPNRDESCREQWTTLITPRRTCSIRLWRHSEQLADTLWNTSYVGQVAHCQSWQWSFGSWLGYHCDPRRQTSAQFPNKKSHAIYEHPLL